jgi:hypothetical protein
MKSGEPAGRQCQARPLIVFLAMGDGIDRQAADRAAILRSVIALTPHAMTSTREKAFPAAATTSTRSQSISSGSCRKSRKAAQAHP